MLGRSDKKRLTAREQVNQLKWSRFHQVMAALLVDYVARHN